MPQLSRFLVTAFCAALFVGMTLGYVSEARARDRSEASGRTVDARGSEPSGGRVDRRRGYEERVFGGGTIGRFRDRREAGYADVRGSAGSRFERRGWRDMDPATNRYLARGSFIRAFAAPADAGGFIEYDGGYVGGVVILDSPGDDGAEAVDRPLPSYPSEPRFIDIETERLDRRPVGPSGIEVTYTGGAKIIRIAPDYSRKASLPDARREVSARTHGNYRQPWSAGWLKYCTTAHRSFDPELGTYVARDGRVRFCEGAR